MIGKWGAFFAISSHVHLGTFVSEFDFVLAYAFVMAFKDMCVFICLAYFCMCVYVSIYQIEIDSTPEIFESVGEFKLICEKQIVGGVYGNMRVVSPQLASWLQRMHKQVRFSGTRSLRMRRCIALQYEF